MSNRNLLIFITLLLIGIAFVVVMQRENRSTGEKISDSVTEVTEEIGDEIDDNTTN